MFPVGSFQSFYLLCSSIPSFPPYNGIPPIVPTYPYYLFSLPGAYLISLSLSLSLSLHTLIIECVISTSSVGRHVVQQSLGAALPTPSHKYLTPREKLMKNVHQRFHAFSLKVKNLVVYHYMLLYKSLSSCGGVAGLWLPPSPSPSPSPHIHTAENL